MEDPKATTPWLCSGDNPSCPQARFLEGQEPSGSILSLPCAGERSRVWLPRPASAYAGASQPGAGEGPEKGAGARTRAAAARQGG